MENYKEVAILQFAIIVIIALGIGYVFSSLTGNGSYCCCSLPLIIYFFIQVSAQYTKERDNERLISSSERTAEQQEKIASGLKEIRIIQIKCSKCKALNDEDSEFCKKCGKKL